jgi:hypothetical protein
MIQIWRWVPPCLDHVRQSKVVVGIESLSCCPRAGVFVSFTSEPATRKQA